MRAKETAPRAGCRLPVPTGKGTAQSKGAELANTPRTQVHPDAESEPDREGEAGAHQRAITQRKGSGGKARRSYRDHKRALKVSEAVFRYGIGRTSLHRLMKSGALRSVKIGRIRLIPVDALEALLKGK